MDAQQLGPLLASAALVAFWAWCLADLYRTDERDVRTFTKPVWVLIVVLLNVAGSLAWVAMGRPQRRP